ncbi:MAG: DNA mismatch endonuclease Vsr [Methyloglobulus sp.]|nr:DNA mismatch endonuclease Vsr [Methyloglobulus sp.]
MTDRIDKETRSRIMAAVRSYGTRPEKRVRSALHRQGFRFRLHIKQLPGTPDLVLRKYKAAIFINGCFWHQHQNCKAAHIPQTRSEFWQKKFTRNELRDQKVLHQLKIMGWRAAIIWECGLSRKQQEDTLRRLALWLKWGGEYLETPVYDEFNEQ